VYRQVYCTDLYARALFDNVVISQEMKPLPRRARCASASKQNKKYKAKLMAETARILTSPFASNQTLDQGQTLLNGEGSKSVLQTSALIGLEARISLSAPIL
jgi:hypothetical protein